MRDACEQAATRARGLAVRASAPPRLRRDASLHPGGRRFDPVTAHFTNARDWRGVVPKGWRENQSVVIVNRNGAYLPLPPGSGIVARRVCDLQHDAVSKRALTSFCCQSKQHTLTKKRGQT
jgi:hypothetical protein